MHNTNYHIKYEKGETKCISNQCIKYVPTFTIINILPIRQNPFNEIRESLQLKTKPPKHRQMRHSLETRTDVNRGSVGDIKDPVNSWRICQNEPTYISMIKCRQFHSGEI